MKVLLLLIFLFLGSCFDDNCSIGEIRCEDNFVQICSSENSWEDVSNCSNVEPKDLNWVCCVSEEACVPEEVCE